MRRIASAAVAYLHACECSGHRDGDGEHAVLLAMVAAMNDTRPEQQTEGDQT